MSYELQITSVVDDAGDQEGSKGASTLGKLLSGDE